MTEGAADIKRYIFAVPEPTSSIVQTHLTFIPGDMSDS